MISIGAIIQRNHVTIGLVLLNYALLGDAISILVIGTFIWFSTLQERADFHKFWVDASPTLRIALQDKARPPLIPFLPSKGFKQFKCCGYFNGTDLAEVGGSYCQSVDFISGLASSMSSNFCVLPITDFADMTLNNLFS